MGAFEYHRGGAGEPLVLLHGIGSCWQCWKPVIPLLERRFEVIALDLPGYGRSAPVAGEPTVFAIGDAVEEIFDELGLDTPHVVGNSMGGAIAAGLATRGLVRSVTAISPGGLSTKREYDHAFRTLSFFYGRARQLAPLAGQLMATPAGRATALAWLHARPWRIPRADAAHQMRMMAGSPSFRGTLAWTNAERPMPPDLGLIDCPFTVAWGTRDLLLPPRQAPRWGRLVPGARVVPLPRAGHIPMIDAPALIVQTILETTARAASPAAPRVAVPVA